MFAPKTSKLVAAGARLTKDFKSSVSVHANLQSAWRSGGATPAEIEPSVYDAGLERFQAEGASECDFALLIRRLVDIEERARLTESYMKAVLRQGNSALGHVIRVEDAASVGRDGQLRPYRDLYGAIEDDVFAVPGPDCVLG